MEDENPSEDEYLLPIHGAASTGERTSNRLGLLRVEVTPDVW